MTANLLKIILVAFLFGVGIWAAICFWQRHSIEKRVRTAEITVENEVVFTPEDSFKVVSASADRDGNICMEYSSRDARETDNIGYAFFGHGETKVRYAMDVDEWSEMCGATGNEDFTFSGK